MGAVQELLKRQQRRRGGSGEPRGALQRLLSLLGEVQRQGREEVVQPEVCGGDQAMII